MARRSKAEAEQTRLTIIDTAMTLFGRKGFASTSLEEIAQDMGVTRGAIYGHFKSKIDLYEQLMSFSQKPLYDLAERAAEHREGDQLEVLREYMIEWLLLLENNPRHRDSFEILLNKTEYTPELNEYLATEYQLTRDMIDSLAKVVRRAVRRGELAKGTDAKLVGLSVYAHLMGITQTWLFNPGLFSLRETAGALVDHYLITLKKAPAGTRR